jgi:hypothetical protein
MWDGKVIRGPTEPSVSDGDTLFYNKLMARPTFLTSPTKLWLVIQTKSNHLTAICLKKACYKGKFETHELKISNAKEDLEEVEYRNDISLLTTQEEGITQVKEGQSREFNRV